MKKLTIRLKKDEDALWALPSIAESVAKHFDGGNHNGVVWRIEDEQKNDSL